MLFRSPTGGLGYNTAVEDAVNLAWKLASVVRGTAPAALLDSYEAERRPLAERNTAYARRFADSVGLFVARPREPRLQAIEVFQLRFDTLMQGFDKRLAVVEHKSHHRKPLLLWVWASVATASTLALLGHLIVQGF